LFLSVSSRPFEVIFDLFLKPSQVFLMKLFVLTDRDVEKYLSPGEAFLPCFFIVSKEPDFALVKFLFLILQLDS
jgi:hypothetical protein